MSLKALLTRILTIMGIKAVDFSSSYGGYIEWNNGLCIQFKASEALTVDSTLTQIGSSGTYYSMGTINLFKGMSAKCVMMGNTRYSTGHYNPFAFNGLNNSTTARISVYDFYARAADDKWKVWWVCIGIVAT